jgi:hypothetical protein
LASLTTKNSFFKERFSAIRQFIFWLWYLVYLVESVWFCGRVVEQMLLDGLNHPRMVGWQAVE